MLTCTAKAEAVILTIHTTDGGYVGLKLDTECEELQVFPPSLCSTTYFFDST